MYAVVALKHHHFCPSALLLLLSWPHSTAHRASLLPLSVYLRLREDMETVDGRSIIHRLPLRWIICFRVQIHVSHECRETRTAVSRAVWVIVEQSSRAGVGRSRPEAEVESYGMTTHLALPENIANYIAEKLGPH